MSSNMASEDVKRLKRRYYWLGGTRFVAGVLSLTMLLFSFFSTSAFMGIVLLFGAISSGLNAFQGFRYGDGPWPQTFVALIALAAGLVFLFHPLAEVIMPSIFLAAFFFVNGMMKVMEFGRLYRIKGSFWILFAGMFEIALSLVLWSDFRAAEQMLGFMFSLSLIVTGISFIMMVKSRDE